MYPGDDGCRWPSAYSLYACRMINSNFAQLMTTLPGDVASPPLLPLELESAHCRIRDFELWYFANAGLTAA